MNPYVFRINVITIFRTEARETEERLRQFADGFSDQISDLLAQKSELEKKQREKDGKCLIFLSFFLSFIFATVSELQSTLEGKEEEMTQLEDAIKKLKEAVQKQKDKVFYISCYLLFFNLLHRLLNSIEL